MTPGNKSFAKFIILPFVCVLAGGAIFGSKTPEPAKATTLAATVASIERLPNYITPTGPAKVIVHGVVACLQFEDLMKVEANKLGLPADIPGMVGDGRCYDVPMGMMVEVVERAKKPDGGNLNPVCIKPKGVSGSTCLWTLIQRLDVRAN